MWAGPEEIVSVHGDSWSLLVRNTLGLVYFDHLDGHNGEGMCKRAEGVWVVRGGKCDLAEVCDRKHANVVKCEGKVCVIVTCIWESVRVVMGEECGSWWEQ